MNIPCSLVGRGSVEPQRPDVSRIREIRTYGSEGGRRAKALSLPGGMRSRVEVYRRPPDGAKRRRVALAEFGQRPKGCECDGVGSRREETPRGKGAKRLAGPQINIASHGLPGSFILNDGVISLLKSF